VSHLMPRAPALHVLDAAIALWVAIWIGLGVAIGLEVAQLTSLSRTVVIDGHAVETVGRSLEPLKALPFVGSVVGQEAARIASAGASTVRGGESTTSSIHVLSVLLALAVALLPSMPVFGFYLPLRLERRRECRALKAAVRAHGEDPAFQTFLAQRALAALSYHQLRREASPLWMRSLESEREQLAAAELRRFGLDPRLLGQRRSRA